MDKLTLEGFGFRKNGEYNSMQKVIARGIFTTVLIIAWDGETWIELRQGKLNWQSHSFKTKTVDELKTLWKSITNKELKARGKKI
jgi:hypothetical protein